MLNASGALETTKLIGESVGKNKNHPIECDSFSPQAKKNHGDETKVSHKSFHFLLFCFNKKASIQILLTEFVWN